MADNIYTLHIPITMPIGCRIRSEKETLSVAGHEARFYEGPLLIQAGGFVDGDHQTRTSFLHVLGVRKDQIEAVTDRIRRAVACLAFQFDEGLIVPATPVQMAQVASHPTTTQAGFDGHSITAVPADALPMPMWATGTSTSEWPAVTLFSRLDQLSTQLGERLYLALELHAESLYEGPRARFILLITILEILADPPLRPRHVVDWMGPIIKTVHQIGGTDAEFEELGKSLEFATNRSYRSSIGAMVHDVMIELGASAEQANAQSRTAKKLYDLRSKMVHEGVRVPPHKLRLDDCRKIVRTVIAHKTKILPNGGMPLVPTKAQSPA